MPTPRPGILLLQLGTPDAPTTPALRRYLAEFLSDYRVVDLNRAIWLPILHLRVLRTRPARSARLYQKVWTSDGSPLAVTSAGQAASVAAGLTERFGIDIPVEVGMRYGNPSAASAIDALLAAGCDRILAVPMYPQYAGATTGSSLEQIFEVLGKRRVVPAVRVVPPYYDAPEYIDALAAGAREFIGGAAPDRIVLSFHGLPKRYAALGDPYPEQCRATANALTAAMGWDAARVTVSFQSRFGREEWLRPYTDETLRSFAGTTKSLVAFCPGFTADCLETIEEMGITNRELYHAAGGGDYRLGPCLNVHPTWIRGLTAIVARELGGWVPDVPTRADAIQS
jgi:ferrochelatase